MKNLPSVCVYCGSSRGQNPAYTEAAKELGLALAKNNIRLIYGAGTTGIMGTLARSVADSYGKVVGIIPNFLVKRESSEAALKEIPFEELVFTKTMHERKALMCERANGFIALPGGIGTLEELIEIMTWAQLGQHSKPIILANIDDFWKPLLSLLEHMYEEGFLNNYEKADPYVANSVEEIIKILLDNFSDN